MKGLGDIIYQDEFCIVRASVVILNPDTAISTSQLRIYVHQKDKEGNELQPNGYMIGSNALMYNQWSPDKERKP